MTTTEVSFPSADPSFDLYGNLTLPPETGGDKIPGIVIVAGSGPIDRDGNVAGSFGLHINTSNRFAEHFGDKIAFLSYDKRGVGKSLKKKATNLYYEAGMYDLVSDAVEAVRFLQSSDKVDPSKIIVMGHSEGSIIMPWISQTIAVDASLNPLFGAIFLAGFGDNLFDAMRAQQDRVLSEVQNETGIKGWAMRLVVTRKRVDKQYEDLMKQIFEENDDMDCILSYCGLVKIPAKWFREHEEYSRKAQTMLSEELKCHCLAITGLKDVQVNPEYCKLSKLLVPNAASIESHTPKNLTHALRCLDDDVVCKLLEAKQEYARMGKLPLDAEMLDIIDSWCSRVLSTS